MTSSGGTHLDLRHADRFFIDGEWVVPSSEARLDVTDSASEQVFVSVAEAQPADVDRAVTAAHSAFLMAPGLASPMPNGLIIYAL
jgi:aldehyde dehydrogenase (NAD+)